MSRPSKLYSPGERPLVPDHVLREQAERLRVEFENYKPGLDPDAFPNAETRKLRDDLASPDPISPSFDEPNEDEINRQIE